MADIKGPFDALLAELTTAHDETITKALKPADGASDDKKIVAAAADGGVDTAKVGDKDDKDGKAAVVAEGDGDGDGDGKPFAKSFKLKLADGSEVDALDGTELFKALTTRVEDTEGVLSKALRLAVDLIKAQGTAVAALQADVAKFADSGKGRKAVLSIAEKPAIAETLAKAGDPEGITPDQFMTKAMSAMAAGKILGSDVSRCEAYFNRGLQPPAELVAKVFA